MPSSLPPALSRPQARWRRRLLWAVGGVLVLEVLYNTVLVTGLLATVINRATHERPKVEWSQAWSLVPGRVHVRNLKLHQEDPSATSWRLEMDEVRVNLSLLSLLSRTLRADALDVRGLRVQVRAATQKTDEEKPPRPPPEDPWKVFLHGVQVQGVHEVRVEAVRLTGVTEAAGSLEVVPGHRVTVRQARLRLGAGELAYDEATVARIEQGSGAFSLETKRKGPDEGLDLISGMTGGRFQFTATHPALHELSRRTPDESGGISLKGGEGKLEVDLHVKEGRLAKGTQLKGTAEPLLLSMGSLRLKAPWRFLLDVYTREDGMDRLGLKLTLGPVKMNGGKELVVETPEVLLLLGAKAPALNELPADAQLELHAKQLHATWGSAVLKGHVHVEADARKMSLQRGRVALHGSQVQLREVSVRTGSDEERNWEGTLTFPEASLALSPPSAQGHFSGNFSNAAPFVALLTFKGALPGVLSPLLKANDLGLIGEVSLGEKEGLKVSKVLANGQGLELRAMAQSGGEAPRAVVLVKMGPLSVGVETGTGDTHVQVFNASSWYREKTGASTE